MANDIGAAASMAWPYEEPDRTGRDSELGKPPIWQTTYGQTNPVFTVSYSGFGTGDDPSVLTGSPSLGTVANTSSPAGTYLITISQGTLAASLSFSFLPRSYAAASRRSNPAHRIPSSRNPVSAYSTERSGDTTRERTAVNHDPEIPQILLWVRLPACLSRREAAYLLNFRDEESVSVMVRARLLKPLGDPPEGAPMWFATVEILRLSQDVKCLCAREVGLAGKRESGSW